MRLADTKNVSEGGGANSGTAMAVPAVLAAMAMDLYIPLNLMYALSPPLKNNN